MAAAQKIHPGLLLNTVVLGAEGAIALLSPKLIFPGMTAYGVAAARHWGASLSTFALISYYANEEKAGESQARVIVSRAGLAYHLFSAGFIVYNYIKELPFAFFSKDHTPNTNTAIAIADVAVHLAIATLLVEEVRAKL